MPRKWRRSNLRLPFDPSFHEARRSIIAANVKKTSQHERSEATKPDRRQEAERICQLILELETGKRQAFLKKTCAGDTSLCKKVESLLLSYPKPKCMIETFAPDGPLKKKNEDGTRSEAREESRLLRNRMLLPKGQKISNRYLIQEVPAPRAISRPSRSSRAPRLSNPADSMCK